MMKRKLTFISAAFLLSAAFTLLACGNNDEINNTTGNTPDGKVDVARSVEFRVNFGGYNSDEETQGTRAARAESGDILSHEYVELDNGLLAEVTVQKDAAEANGQRPATRALEEGKTYTMLAYQSGVYKGMVKGTVTGGTFTASGTTDGILLDPGDYTFVLLNSKVNFDENSHVISVSRANAPGALIGRREAKITATTGKQEITFNMMHAGSRMRIQFTGYMPIVDGTAVTLTGDGETPSMVKYNVANMTETWTVGEKAVTSANLAFPASTELPFANETNEYKSLSQKLDQGGEKWDYVYFLPKTNPSKLKLEFTGGKIYGVTMSGVRNLSVSTLPEMKSNGSYIISIKLKYAKFTYLMSDGTEGSISETTFAGGSKTPIGVVLSEKNAAAGQRLAIALEDAEGSPDAKWYTGTINRINNYIHYDGYQDHPTKVQSYNDMDGYKYTWESNAPRGDEAIKGDNLANYPAFYRAGHYGDKLAAKNITMTGDIAGKKWHLPSNGEWKLVFTKLGLGDESQLTAYYKWVECNPGMINLAFLQVGGSLVVKDDIIEHTVQSSNPDGKARRTEFWSSTYTDHGIGTEGNVSCFRINEKGKAAWGSPEKNHPDKYRTRAFLRY